MTTKKISISLSGPLYDELARVAKGRPLSTVIGEILSESLGMTGGLPQPVAPGWREELLGVMARIENLEEALTRMGDRTRQTTLAAPVPVIPKIPPAGSTDGTPVLPRVAPRPGDKTGLTPDQDGYFTPESFAGVEWVKSKAIQNLMGLDTSKATNRNAVMAWKDRNGITIYGSGGSSKYSAKEVLEWAVSHPGEFKMFRNPENQ